MLRLADEVDGDQACVGGVVGDHEDLGGAGFGIRPDQTRDRALGRRHEVVAGTGDDVHRLEAERRDAVRERADRSGAAHRVHLGDAEEPRGTEDHRVHPAAELALRR